jgi:hypothetical protein
MPPRTIFASRARSALLAAGAIVFVAGCLWILGRHDITPKGLVAGWLGTPFFSLCAVAGLIGTIRPAELQIGEKGFLLKRWLGGPLEVAWRDVEPLIVWRYRSTALVAWRYLPGRGRSDLTAKINARFGVNGTLPGHFEMAPGALAEVMNNYRRHAMATDLR